MSTKARLIDDYFRKKDYYPHIPYRPIGEIIVQEVERMGKDGLFLSTACALVEHESGGKNIFGCDHGSRWTNVPPYCQVRVTKTRVQRLIETVENGGGQNGVGYTQLTSIDFVREAEKEGGAHLPGPNMRVGFRVLNSNIASVGWPAGAAAYNAGLGNWRSVIDTYGAELARKERQWAERLEKAEPGHDHKPEPKDRPKQQDKKGPDKQSEMKKAGRKRELSKAHKAITYMLQLREPATMYGFWDGKFPFTPGPAMWANVKTGHAPDPKTQVPNTSCTGLINLGNAAGGCDYRGGTLAYAKDIKNKRRFKLGMRVKKGEVLLDKFMETSKEDEGHIVMAIENGTNPRVISSDHRLGGDKPGVNVHRLKKSFEIFDYDWIGEVPGLGTD